MKKISVKGPSIIRGRLVIQGSKNAALTSLAASLLTDDDLILENVPQIADIETNLSILKQLRARVQWLDKNSLLINCSEVANRRIDPELAIKTTTSKFFIPVLVNRFGEVTTGRSLGDQIGGDRGFGNFLKQMSQVGIDCERKNAEYRFSRHDSTVKNLEIDLDFPSYSATVSLVLGHVLGKGSIIISNVNQSELLDNLLNLLTGMGAQIVNSGRRLKVAGVEKLRGSKFRNLSDHNALVSYSMAALITNSSLEISAIDDVKLQAFWKFLVEVGAQFRYDHGRLNLYPSLDSLKPVDIWAASYPHFHSDWQSSTAPLLTQIRGTSSIVDDLWPDRFAYWQGLDRMGADYEFFQPEDSRFRDGKLHGVKVKGPVQLKGCSVSCPPDIRGSVALVIAALAAEGKTILLDTEQIERGYEDLVGVLSSLGASISYES